MLFRVLSSRNRRSSLALIREHVLHGSPSPFIAMLGAIAGDVIGFVHEHRGTKSMEKVGEIKQLAVSQQMSSHEHWQPGCAPPKCC